MKKLLLILFISIGLIGCATHYTSATYLDSYGFFSGLWHGFIVIFVAIGKLLSWVLSFVDINVLEEIKFIGQPNTGISYYIGFAIGIMFLGSMGKS